LHGNHLTGVSSEALVASTRVTWGNMAADLHYSVSFLDKSIYQPIAGVAYAIWKYQIAWTSGHPQNALGLALSSLVDVKDPADFPAVSEIQNTSLAKTPGEPRQFVWTDAPPDPKAVTQNLAFLAPDLADPFAAIQLAEISGDVQKFLKFTTASAASPSLVQTLAGPAPAPAPPQVSGPAPTLDNSSRRINKATLVSLKIDTTDYDGRALLKFGLVRQLGLQPGEVDRVAPQLSEGLRAVLRQFEGAPIAAQLPHPRTFESISVRKLRDFTGQLVAARRQAISAPPPRTQARSIAPAVSAAALNQFTASVAAQNWFEANFSVTPIGMLNLERIVMTPVGIERGGLIATIPLAPLEETAVVHKEWSVTSQEFTSIVTDSLENYSATGVTENTELSQATQSQTSHNNQFNVNGTVTGSYGPVTATVTTSFSAQDANSQSASESRKHAIATTRQASSRVKREHKVTITTQTVTGTSESSTRILKNPSSTDAIRIDYFSIMRKWHVGLYRYGLRLTYDIAIPEPGSALRKIYAELDNLKSKIGPFSFDVQHSDITTNILPGETQPHYMVLAERYSAEVPPPPGPLPDVIVSSVVPNTDGAALVILPDLDIPDGYWITNLFLQFSSDSKKGVPFVFRILGSALPAVNADSGNWPDPPKNPLQANGDLAAAANGSFLFHASGRCQVTCRVDDNRQTFVRLRAVIAPTDANMAQWVLSVWNALYNAAQTQYYSQQQQYQNRIADLTSKLENVDTLTLRREENEQIMKGVLRWLLGPSFDFMPDDVRSLFKDPAQHNNLDLRHGTVFDAAIGDGLNVTAAGWYPMFMYQEMVKFINEAIEWENVLYFLYSYFWDVPESWDFIRQIEHPDSTRQAFLRAGSARVVLTVRKGWEQAWVQFVEAGDFGKTLIPGHPYLSIAKEIQDYDSTNYPGIPPANPGGGPLPDDGESVATQCSAKLDPSAGPVMIEVMSSEGFIPGYTAIIGDYATGSTAGGVFTTAQENQTILAVPDKTHIQVARLDSAHDGTLKPFPVMQAGEMGQLIAEWFEYTPTSGTDIAVTSNLAAIS
jgi:hypothetical protein